MSRILQYLSRSVAVLLLAALGLWGGGLSATVLVLLVGLTLVSLVGIDIRQRMKYPEDELAEPKPSLRRESMEAA